MAIYVETPDEEIIEGEYRELDADGNYVDDSGHKNALESVYEPPESDGWGLDEYQEPVAELASDDDDNFGKQVLVTTEEPEESPQFRVDVEQKGADFTVDEAMVVQMVQDAMEDHDDNLLEPLWAFVNIRPTLRHHKRFIRVMGSIAKWKSMAKTIGVVAGVFGGILVALLNNNEMNWIMDALFAAGFAGFLAYVSRSYLGYKEAFVKVYTVERADFTDPGQVTGVSTVHLPRLAYYGRPDVWRGNDGKNGIRDSDAIVVLQTGYDVVTWLPPSSQTEDKEVWCHVETSKRLSDFRIPPDYYDLPADTYTVNGDSMKMRRAICRQLQRNGEMYAKSLKGGLSWLDGKWGWICAGVLALSSVLIVMFTMGGG